MIRFANYLKQQAESASKAISPFYRKFFAFASMNLVGSRLTGLALAGLLFSINALAQDVPACGDQGNMKFICGVPTPEDLLQIPGTDWIIGSGLADLKNPIPFSGNLSLIDGKGHTAAVIVLNPDDVARAPYTACSAPPDPARFSAHGLDIRPSANGMSTLFVVGHGAREAVEVFEIDAKAKVPKVKWIGCVPAAQGAFNNAVVGLPDGRIIVTDFLHGGTGFADLYAGRVTGAVYVWAPGGMFKKLPGTDMSGPNGLAVSADQKYMFVADSGKASVLRFELAATEKPPTVIDPGLRTDNIRWSPDGQLLLAGPIPDPTCRKTGATCREMQVVKSLDPSTLVLKTVIAFRASAAFDYLSSALIMDGTLWLGSPNGNGVVYTKLP
jgi:SMP-30/Gluconolactonase/LRE-like region